jgi:hypothetical protein
MIKYQGETIKFSIDIINTGQITSFDQIEKMVVYFYTSWTFLSKHSIDNEEGYCKMTIDGTKAKGVIEHTDTRKMSGNLIMDVMIVDTNGNRRIVSKPTSITIENRPISAEI